MRHYTWSNLKLGWTIGPSGLWHHLSWLTAESKAAILPVTFQMYFWKAEEILRRKPGTSCLQGVSLSYGSFAQLLWLLKEGSSLEERQNEGYIFKNGKIIMHNPKVPTSAVQPLFPGWIHVTWATEAEANAKWLFVFARRDAEHSTPS